jgi:hypothetical protein
MPKEKFVRRHLTQEEKDRLFRRSEETTEAEKENAKRFLERVKVMGKNERKKALTQGCQVMDDDVYEKIDTSPETRGEDR